MGRISAVQVYNQVAFFHAISSRGFQCTGIRVLVNIFCKFYRNLYLRWSGKTFWKFMLKYGSNSRNILKTWHTFKCLIISPFFLFAFFCLNQGKYEAMHKLNISSWIFVYGVSKKKFAVKNYPVITKTSLQIWSYCPTNSMTTEKKFNYVTQVFKQNITNRKI